MTMAIDNSADHDAHMYLGNMHLAMGDTAQAEKEFTRASALLPSEASKQHLAAVRKRRAEERRMAQKSIQAVRAA